MKRNKRILNRNQAPLLRRVFAKGFFLFLFFLPVFCYSQKKVEIVNAGSLKFDNKIGNGAKRLIGDVQFKHESALMFCDSAYFYADNSLDAFGHVRILQNDGSRLNGDFLKYNGNTKLAVLTKNVMVSKGDMQLTTDVLNYDIASSTGYYTTPGRIVNKENILTSDRGTFFSKNNEFNFKKNVVLTNPQFVINCDTMRYNTLSKITYFLGPTTIKGQDNLIYCEDGWYDTKGDLSRFNKNAYIISKEQKMIGDSLYYDRKQGIGTAVKNVRIIDTTQNLVIKGDYAVHYEQRDISLVTGHAVLVQKYDNDSLFLHADTLKAVGNNSKNKFADSKVKTEETKTKNKNQKTKNAEAPAAPEKPQSDGVNKGEKKLFAYHKVKFFKKDLQGKCDSLIYKLSDSTMKLYGKPVIWSDENQLTADSIKLLTGGKALKSMELLGRAFIVSEEKNERYNQIRGKYMKGFFKKTDLYRIKVEGNGQTIYYAKEKGELKAVNRADCSNLNIYLKDKKIDHITFLTKPDATLYPLEQIDEKELRLKDFTWRMKERPLKISDIFVW